MSQASRFSKVFVKIWYSNDFRSLSEDGKLLFLYLLTSPHRNMGGCYSIPIPYLCYDLNLEEKRVWEALAELTHNQMVFYDHKAQVALILKWFLYNPIENKNQAIGLNKQLAELPSNDLMKALVECIEKYCKYKDVILEGLAIPCKREREPFGNPLETLPEPYAKPGAGSVTETVTGTGSGDKNICASDDARAHKTPQPGESVEAEKVTATPETKSGPRSPFRSKRQEQLFDEFWEQYPKRRSKGRAEKTWQKICPDDVLFAEIMHGLALAKASNDWGKNGGQFIPYPATWLHAKGWEDEYLPAARDGPRYSENVEKGLSLVEKYRHQDCEKGVDCV